jgi:hypothetical protein
MVYDHYRAHPAKTRRSTACRRIDALRTVTGPPVGTDLLLGDDSAFNHFLELQRLAVSKPPTRPTQFADGKSCYGLACVPGWTFKPPWWLQAAGADGR